MRRGIVLGLAGFAMLLTPLSMATAAAEAPIPLTAADEAPAAQPVTTNSINSPADTGSASTGSALLNCLMGKVPSCL